MDHVRPNFERYIYVGSARNCRKTNRIVEQSLGGADLNEHRREALQLLARTEGIIPALEPAHALAWLVRGVRSGEVGAGATVLLTLSGRGDKDAEQVMRVLG